MKVCLKCGKEGEGNFCINCGGAMQEVVYSDNEYSSNRVLIETEPEGFLKVWQLVLLTLVTFCIYLFVWIHRTTKLLNKKLQPNSNDDSGTKVLLCLFVPGYTYYWMYKTCERIEAYNKKVGLSVESFSVLVLVLGLLGLLTYGVSSFVAFGLMQNKLNTALMFEQNRTKVSENIEVKKAFEPIAKETFVSNTTEENKGINKNTSIVKDSVDTIKALRELKQLFDEGIITEEEFDYKKKELLK